MEQDTRNVMEKFYNAVRREKRGQERAKQLEEYKNAYQAELSRARAEKAEMERNR